MSSEAEVLDPGEAAGGLFLVVAPGPPADLADRLDALLATGGTVGVLVPANAPDPALAGQIRVVCLRHGVALFTDRLEAVETVAASGLLLDDPAAVAPARRRFGKEMLIGACAGVSRHAAMSAGEDDADFIAFGSLERAPSERLRETLAWWSEVFVLPSLALARLEAEGEVEDLRHAGADFVAVPTGLLLGSDDPGAMMARLKRAAGAL